MDLVQDGEVARGLEEEGEWDSRDMGQVSVAKLLDIRKA